jgi:hypothetical protein
MSNKIFLIILVSMLFIPIVYAPPVGFTQGVCGQIILSSGEYVLTEDILDCIGSPAIDIEADDVVLDCDGHIIELDNATTNPAIVIRTNRDNVEIKNCNVTGEGATVGIEVKSNAYVHDNNVYFDDPVTGIRISYGSDSVVSNNYVAAHSGIQATGIGSNKNNIIEDNHVVGGGIIISKNRDCTIRNNLIEDVEANGIYLNQHVGCCQIYGNDVDAVNSALHIDRSSGNHIYDNSFTSTSTDIANILALQNLWSTNFIYYNTFTSHDEVMFYFDDASTTRIYNNLFNSSSAPEFYSGLDMDENKWSFGVDYGKRIVGPGEIIGGNFWATFDGTGYSETCTDANTDGFCDDEYVLNSDNKDGAPLSNQFEESSSCGMVILENTVLTEDILNCTMPYGLSLIGIVGDNIELDCDGHWIKGTVHDFSHNAGIEVYYPRYQCGDGINRAKNVTIRNCNIEVDGGYGIYFSRLQDGLIENNFINSTNAPIWSSYSSDNTIRNNIGYANTDDSGGFMYLSGINLVIDGNEFIPNPDIQRPNAVTNRQTGISMMEGGHCNNITISNNILPTNSFAVQIGSYCEYYHIFGNTLGIETDEYYTEYCLRTAGSHGIIEDNWMYADYGTLQVKANHQRYNSENFWDSGVDNVIRNNIIKGGHPVEIRGDAYEEYKTVYYPLDTQFYNNLVNESSDWTTISHNSTNAVSFAQGHIWDGSEWTHHRFYPTYFNTTQQNGTRISGLGSQIGGNFWANVWETGYSETCADVNSDGFCDIPLVFNDYNDTVDNTDYLPLSNDFSYCEKGTNADIEVTYPVGGETLGGVITITWDMINLTCGNAAMVDLVLYKGGTVYKPIETFARVSINDGSYDLDTDIEDIINAHGYQVRVQLVSQIGINDLSGMFSIDNSPAQDVSTSSGGGGGSGSGGAPAVTTESSEPEPIVVTSEYTTSTQSTGSSTPLNVGGSSHTVTVDSVSGDEATITVESDPITFNLKVGQEKLVDVDPNSRYLMQVKLNSIIGDDVDLAFKQILRSVTSNSAEIETSSETTEADITTDSSASPITGAAIMGLGEFSNEVVGIVIIAAVILIGLFVTMKFKKKS